MSIVLNGSTGEVFPSWTALTRPASPSIGQVGYNTSFSTLEMYTGTAWYQVTTSLASNAVTFLMAGGGGGGGGAYGAGGGGAGGIITGIYLNTPGTVLSFTIGAAGIAGTGTAAGGTGGNTTAFGMTAYGGGGGGSDVNNSAANGTSGASGGGSATLSSSVGTVGSAISNASFTGSITGLLLL